jgi:hypothetical protein
MFFFFQSSLGIPPPPPNQTRRISMAVPKMCRMAPLDHGGLLLRFRLLGLLLRRVDGLLLVSAVDHDFASKEPKRVRDRKAVDESPHVRQKGGRDWGQLRA